MAGIYIHIPFCKSRCRYCDFFSSTLLSRQSDYVLALLAEWNARHTQLRERVRTIYIGGGTPSTLTPALLQQLLRGILSMQHLFAPVLEITMEVNPADVTLENAMLWRSFGINRLSIGIQSFNDSLLSLIGRRHTAQQAIHAVHTAQQAGFDNISIDLMYALPTQTINQWHSDIQQALSLGIQHISSYGLIYEDGTQLTSLLHSGQIQAVDEQLEMEMYDILVSQLTQSGFVHYEVSNFALPGRESKHNSSYWHDVPYIGLGAAAHSYDGRYRQWNISDIDIYIQQAFAMNLQPESEEIDAQVRHMERVMLGLRTNQGVSIHDVRPNAIEQYLSQGLLRLEDNRVVATTQGFHILNRIIEDLL